MPSPLLKSSKSFPPNLEKNPHSSPSLHSYAVLVCSLLWPYLPPPGLLLTGGAAATLAPSTCVKCIKVTQASGPLPLLLPLSRTCPLRSLDDQFFPYHSGLHIPSSAMPSQITPYKVAPTLRSLLSLFNRMTHHLKLYFLFTYILFWKR